MLDLIMIPRFALVSMVSRTKNRAVVDEEIAEAKALVATYGGEVVVTVSQNESHLNQHTFMGKGKVAEVARLVQDEAIDVVVINDALSAGQLFRLATLLGKGVTKTVEVWDRTDLILHIFKQHATTAEAKLQIKLAETQHKGPELYGMGKQMSQQGAGIGTRGLGETNTEIMKRHWRAEIGRIEAELAKLTQNRQQQMERRKRLRLPTISIVGYTNAGKSSLFNLLTKKQVLVEDAPFATLDSSVGKLYLHGLKKEAFITDTIGFIQHLPPELIQAFSSTLLETVQADLLLVVVDVADEFFPEKIASVEQVLADLGVETHPRLYVFNKIDSDQIEDVETLKQELAEDYGDYPLAFVSAKTEQGIMELIAMVEKFVSLPTD